MARREFDLKTILDIPLWETVQDQIAKLTGTAIITIDFKGNPITKHSCRTDFCSIIRENPVSRKRCYKCDALAGLEAVRLERPYIYLCHCGIVDVAVPVMVGDRYLGAVMFGQVRIAHGDTAQVQRLVSEISSFQAETETTRIDLLEKYNQLPEMEYKRVVEIANLISAIVEYIVDRAVKNSNDKQAYEWILSMGRDSGSAGGNIQELRDPSIGVRENTEEQAPTPVKKDSPLYPAIAYINDHPAETVTMKDMAELCHLSPSYFSRLFSRELGETFVNYVNRGKIERAKKLLRESSMSVSQIAADAGYIDTSHFIQLFKRFEGVTPTMYRQYNYR